MPAWFECIAFTDGLKSLSRVSELLDVTELRGLSFESENLRGLCNVVDKFSADDVTVDRNVVLRFIAPIVKLFERRVFTAMWSLSIGKQSYV